MEDLKNKFFTMMPLDMLAEVASATLQNDPSLNSSYKSKSTPRFNKIYSPKKSITTSEMLTLDQIRALSDKMLLEMFSELTSDEMRKNYSFKCYLMPDKCSTVFTSFGNEAKSRLQMKTHLLSHIKDLVADTKGKSAASKFTAEPLHVLKKRLKEKNPRFPRKKKTKQSTAKKKNNKIYTKKEYYQKGFESSKHKNHKELQTDSQDSYQSSKSVHISLSTKKRKSKFKPHLKKCTSTSTVYSEYKDFVSEDNHLLAAAQDEIPEEKSVQNYFKERTCLDLQDDSYLYSSDENSNEKFSVSIDETKHGTSFPNYYAHNRAKWNRENETRTFNDGNAHTKTNTIFISEENCSSFHDHTYTSVFGKTCRCELSPAPESSRSVKTLRDFRKSFHHCSDIAVQLIIPTPPFPYVYVPLLPHISEIREVGNTCTSSCDQCLYNYYIDGLQVSDSVSTDFHCHTDTISADENEEEYQNTSRTATPETEQETDDDDDDDDILSDSLADDISDDDALSETSDSKIPGVFCMDDLLNCPENLQEKIQD